MISLRALTESNRAAVEALGVSRRQEQFVTGVADSLLESVEDPNGRFGTATLDLIVEYFRRRPEVEVMSTSAGQGDGSPIPFYEGYGFVQTGELVFDGEILLRLDLRTR